MNFQLLYGGDVLQPDGIAGRLDQVDHRRGDAEFEVFGGLPETVDVRHMLRAESRGQRLEGRDALLPEQLLPGRRQVRSLVKTTRSSPGA